MEFIYFLLFWGLLAVIIGIYFFIDQRKEKRKGYIH